MDGGLLYEFNSFSSIACQRDVRMFVLFPTRVMQTFHYIRPDAILGHVTVLQRWRRLISSFSLHYTMSMNVTKIEYRDAHCSVDDVTGPRDSILKS